MRTPWRSGRSCHHLHWERSGTGDNHKGLLRLPQQLRELRDVGGDAVFARILPVVGLNLLAGGAGHDLVGINGGILSRRPLSLVLGVPRNVLLSSLPSTKRPLLRRFAALEEAATTTG